MWGTDEATKSFIKSQNKLFQGKGFFPPTSLFFTLVKIFSKASKQL